MSVIICHAFVVASGSGLGNSLISSKKQKLVSVANVCNIFACLQSQTSLAQEQQWSMNHRLPMSLQFTLLVSMALRFFISCDHEQHHGFYEHQPFGESLQLHCTGIRKIRKKRMGIKNQPLQKRIYILSYSAHGHIESSVYDNT